VSDTITLALRAAPDHMVECDGITPDRLASLGAQEIAALPLWSGRRTIPLGDLFTVRGERAATVRIEGGAGLSRLEALGAGMTHGELVIEGDAGRYVGSRMSGGTLVVRGDAGDGAGLEMAGGTLEITGRAGDRLGGARSGASRGMTGGEIVVRGAAGSEAGANARRGLIVIGGDAGERAAHRMIAGTVLVLGAAAEGAGSWSKRGSVVVLGAVVAPPTFRYSCTYQPPHLSLTLLRLRARYRLTIDSAALRGLYRRYCGDLADVGKGEILAWTGR
jgi:formylmethanofuran dehydrogenase subunit C